MLVLQIAVGVSVAYWVRVSLSAAGDSDGGDLAYHGQFGGSGGYNQPTCCLIFSLSLCVCVCVCVCCVVCDVMVALIFS
eukprot:COSAG05_NODE_274_length_12437_cov_130.209353_8_plen_79_part_00